MKTATTLAYTLLRLTAVVQIGLGLLFWTGNALSLIPVHMLSGTILVLMLWVLALLALLSGANRGLAGLAFVWGLIVPVLGMTQGGLLPGPMHWVIEVLHLVVGLIAIGMGERLARGLQALYTAPRQQSLEVS